MRKSLPPLLLLCGVSAALSPLLETTAPSDGAAVSGRVVAASAWVLAAGQGKGSGFVIDAERRLLLTCYHVVGENQTCDVVFVWNKDGKAVADRQLYLEQMPQLQRRGIALEGKVIRRSKDKDLALVELPSLPAGVVSLSLAPLPAPPGQPVWAVGNRFDVNTLFTVAAGRVRFRQHKHKGYFTGGQHLATDAKVITTDVPINEGDSGGPLVNHRAHVVGVCSAVAWEAHGGAIAIDVSEIRAFLALGNDVPSSTPPSPGAAAYRRALPATALVNYDGGGDYAGVVVDRARRLVLTTADAVAREKTVQTTFAPEQAGGAVIETAWLRQNRALLSQKGYASAGVVLAIDPRRNLALIEVERLPPTAAAVVLSPTPASPGELLHLITHPPRLEARWAYSAAVVRQTERFLLGRAQDGPAPAVLIAQAPLGDGEGGGPALNERGELAGLVSGKIGAQQQIAYLLAASEIRAFLEEARPVAAPNTPAERLARAALLVAARQYRRADEAYAEVLKGERNAAALAGRAWLAQLTDQPDEALALGERALALDARQVTARHARAAAWLRKGDPRNARAEGDLAVEHDPRSALSFALRALARLELGDLPGAASDADEAAWLDAKLALACLARGRVLAARDQPRRALEEYARAVALDPYLSEAHRRRGDLLWHGSDVDGSLDSYEQALKLAPADVLALLGRARALLAKGRHDAGLADLDEVIRHKPELAEAYLHRGGEKVRRNWVNKGAADLLEAVRRRPELLASALGELERKAADLPSADEAMAYRLVLTGLVARLDEALRRRVEACLAEAKGQKEVKQAESLRGMVAVVMAKSAER